MRKNDGTKIISTGDIFLSADSSDLGKDLDDVLRKQNEGITELRQNVKYIFKNGTMGGGHGGSGSGGNSSASFAASAIISSTDGSFSSPITTDSSIIALNGRGSYSIVINLSKTQGHSFKVSYQLGTNKEISLTSSSMQYQALIDVQDKTSLIINVYDETADESITLTGILVPTPYVITSFVQNAGTQLQDRSAYDPDVLNNAELTIKATINTPSVLNYIVKGKKEADLNWTILAKDSFATPSNAGESSEQTLHISLDKANLTKEDTGTYYEIQLIYDYNTNPTQVRKDYQFTVISDNLYILLSSDKGQLVREYIQNSFTPEEFQVGYLPVNLTVYHGSSDINSSRQLQLNIQRWVDNEWQNVPEIPDSTNTITVRTTYNLSDTPFLLRIAQGGNYKITASIIGTEQTTTIKYFKVSQSKTTLTYKKYEEDHLGETNAKYNYNGTSAFMNQSLQLYESNLYKALDNRPKASESNCITNIALGLQYSRTNNSNTIIARLHQVNGYNLEITQDSIIYKASDGTTKFTISYYLPMVDKIDFQNNSSWHLLNINFNLIRIDTVNKYYGYEANVYIDGKLDGSYNGNNDNNLITDTFIFDSIDINPNYNNSARGSFGINLLDVSYFSKSNDFFADSKGIITSESTGSNLNLWDPYADWYNYTYKQSIDSTYLREYSSTLSSNFEYDIYSTPYLTFSNMQNFLLDKGIKVPILIIKPGPFNGLDYLSENSDFFKDWLLRIWGENDETGYVTSDVYYISDTANKEPVGFNINNYLITSKLINGGSDKITFNIRIQGSSTKGFGGKNLSIEISQPGDGQTTRVFTPNYKNREGHSEDYKTMLPEKRFNLKADEVDSSHCNNNAIGDFVNANQSQIGGSDNNARSDTKYGKHVKNCLTGFPCLVFIAYGGINNAQIDINKCNFYYLGVYNFNMGREAYFNLGYYNLNGKSFPDEFSNLKDDGSDTFQIIEYPTNELEIDPQLVVAEISTGNPYFDFSQYDQSVLFNNYNDGKETENAGMFGDLVYNNRNVALSELQKLVESVAKAGGYVFQNIGKNLVAIGPAQNGQLPTFPYLNGDQNGNSYNEVSDYRIQYQRTLGTSNYKEALRDLPNATLDDLVKCIQNTTQDGNTNNDKILDLTTLVQYYVICMCFGMVDSVLKNMEIKKWGNIFYIAFYDMDTALDDNNSGQYVSYFAFSDYWKINNKLNSAGTAYDIMPADVYPDYFHAMSGVTGYDIPSSYLFAIAKYAYSDSVFGTVDQTQSPKITGNYDGTTYEMTPVNFYAQLRSTSLTSADVFMNTYFNRLKDVPDYLINLNYRAKYLRTYLWGYDKLKPTSSYTTSYIDQNGNKVEQSHDTELSNDTSKFKGCQYYQKRDWLESRLRLLDAYFNVDAYVNYPVKKYDLATNTWSTLKKADTSDYLYPKINDSLYTKLQSNNDIKILQSILGKDTKSTAHGMIDITAPEYSPFIYSPQAGTYTSYLIGGYNSDGTLSKYRLNLTIDTNQQWMINGSSFWYSVSDLGVFNLSNYNISSDNLKDIILLSTQRSSNCTGVTLVNTPSAETITINGNRYSGELQLNSNLNRLYKIDLSDTSMTLSDSNSRSLKVSTLILNGINSSQILLPTWDSLNEVKLNNATITTLSLNSWSKEIRLYGYNSGNSNYVNNLNVTTLTLNSKNGGSLLIDNIKNLTTLNLSGFDNITILNCTNLTKLNLSGSNLKRLVIQGCSTTSDSLTAGNNTKEVDLSSFINLTDVDFYNTIGIEKIILPSKKINLGRFGRANGYNDDLKYIDGSGTFNISQNAAFNGCRKFTFKKAADKTYCNIYFTGKDVSNTFNHCESINLSVLQEVLNSHLNTDIINMSAMFAWSGVELNSGTCLLNNGVSLLAKFTKVTNMDNFLLGSKTNMICKELYNFGASGCTYRNIIAPYSIQMFKDTFNSVTNKCSAITFTYNGQQPRVFVVTDYISGGLNGTNIMANSSKVLYSNIKLKDVFPIDTNNLLTDFEGLDIVAETVDCDGAFDNLKALNTISAFFCHKISTYNITYKNTDKLFYGLTNLLNVSRIWYNQSTTINLYQFFNDNFLKNGHFTRDDNNSTTRGYYVPDTFNVNKTLTEDQFNSIMQLIEQNPNENCNYLFRNCKVTGLTTNIKQIRLTNKHFTDISFLFENCKFYQGGTEVPMQVIIENPNLIYLRQTFSECLLSTLTSNFFNKRQKQESKVYIKGTDGYLTEVPMVQYIYNSNILNMYRTFYNTKLDQPYSDQSNILKNVINNDESITEYYISATKELDSNGKETGKLIAGTYDAVHTLNNDLFNDLTFTPATIQQTVTIGKDITATNPNISNYGLIVPPDILYGVSGNATIIGCFGTSDEGYLEGVIPAHLLSSCNNISPEGLFENQYVIPTLIFEDTTNNKDIKYYSFVPSNYTNFTQLSKAFNFYMLLPNYINETTYEQFYIIQNNSISDNIISMQNSLPYKYQTIQIDTQNNTMYCHLGIAGTVTNSSVIDGLDLVNKSRMRLDNLIQAPMTYYMSGRIFVSGYTFNQNKVNSGNFVISSVGTNGLTGLPFINSGIILPNLAQNWGSGFICNTTTQISKNDKSDSENMYKN